MSGEVVPANILGFEVIINRCATPNSHLERSTKDPKHTDHNETKCNYDTNIGEESPKT